MLHYLHCYSSPLLNSPKKVSIMITQKCCVPKMQVWSTELTNCQMSLWWVWHDKDSVCKWMFQCIRPTQWASPWKYKFVKLLVHGRVKRNFLTCCCTFNGIFSIHKQHKSDIYNLRSPCILEYGSRKYRYMPFLHNILYKTSLLENFNSRSHWWYHHKIYNNVYV